MNHEKCLGFFLFQEQEGRSTKGKSALALRAALVDRIRKPGDYVHLPEPGQIRAAEVYDGGPEYSDALVVCSASEEQGHRKLIVTDVAVPGCSLTPPLLKRQRTENMVDLPHLRWKCQ